MSYLVFDYDTIAYQAGFASEDRSILVTHKNTKETWKFKNRTEFAGRDKSGGWLGSVNETKDSPWGFSEFEIQDIQEPKPESVVLEILTSKIGSVRSRLRAKNYYGWMGNGSCFRNEIATIAEYKGGARKDSAKPLHLPFIRQILLEKYNAKIATNNLEADDWLSIDSYVAWQDWSKTKSDRHRLIAITEDKDHLQCTGHFFNPSKMILAETVYGFGSIFWRDDTMTPTLSGRGRMWLYNMWLCGDKVDNIKPYTLSQKRFGDTSSFELLSGCKTDKEAIQKVVDTYKMWYPQPVTYASWTGEIITKDWIGISQEIFDLVRMRRWPDDKVDVMTVIDKMGIKVE